MGMWRMFPRIRKREANESSCNERKTIMAPKAKGSDHLSKIAVKAKHFDYATLWDHNKKKLKAFKREDPNVLFKGDRVRRAGDDIEIPKSKKKGKKGALDKTNPFRVSPSSLWLRLRITHNDLSPVKKAPYTLVIDPGKEIKDAKGKVIKPFKGKTDGKGHIEIEIPDYFKIRKSQYAETASLTVRVKAADTDAPSAKKKDGDGDEPPVVKPKPAVRGEVPVTWKLFIGRLNPIREKAPDDDCVSGVQARLNNLNINSGPVDGKWGPNTKAAIKAFKQTFQVGGEEEKPDAAMQDKLNGVHDSASPPAVPAKKDS